MSNSAISLEVLDTLVYMAEVRLPMPEKMKHLSFPAGSTCAAELYIEKCINDGQLIAPMKLKGKLNAVFDDFISGVSVDYPSNYKSHNLSKPAYVETVEKWIDDRLIQQERNEMAQAAAINDAEKMYAKMTAIKAKYTDISNKTKSGDTLIFNHDEAFEKTKTTGLNLIQTLIPSDSIGMIFGDPSSRKTFCAVAIAASISTGVDFAGLKVNKVMPVGYFTTEAPERLSGRFKAWAQHRGMKTSDVRVAIDKAPMSLPTDTNQMIASINKMSDYFGENVGYIVVDTLSKYMDGEENSKKDFGEVFRALIEIRNKTGVSILVNHHNGKNDKDGNNNGARGSSAMKGDLDFIYEVKARPYNAITRTGISEVMVGKNGKAIKDGVAFESAKLALKEIDLGCDCLNNKITSLVVENGSLGEAVDAKVEVRESAKNILNFVMGTRTFNAAEKEDPSLYSKKKELVRAFIRVERVLKGNNGNPLPMKKVIEIIGDHFGITSRGGTTYERIMKSIDDLISISQVGGGSIDCDEFELRSISIKDLCCALEMPVEDENSDDGCF